VGEPHRGAGARDGLVGALLAGGLDPERAACAAAWIHGRAAELAPGGRLVAGDLVEALPRAMGDLGGVALPVDRV